jgi:hypothetical protein
MFNGSQRSIVTGRTAADLMADQVRLNKRYEADADARREEMEKRFGKGVPMRELDKATQDYLSGRIK